MTSLSKMAGACVLAALLAACGGGGGGADAAGATGANDVADTAGKATGETGTADGGVTVGQVAAPAADQPADPSAAPVDVLVAEPTMDAVSGAEPITEVAESLATDPWVKTWVDADLDAYYPTRPIRVSVTGQGTVSNSVRGTAGPMSCVQGGSSCGVSYTKYKTVLLSAVPKAGQVFRGWGGACSGSGARLTCEIRNYMLHNVSATFAPA
jgi:hypothetical protein